MPAMTLGEWKGAELEKLIASSVDTKLKVIGSLLVNEIKEELVKKDNIDGIDPSEPGEPPAKVTGRLSSSISYNIEGTTLRVGTNVLYGKFLELGWRVKTKNGMVYVPPRPFLRPVAIKNQKQIGEILGK